MKFFGLTRKEKLAKFRQNMGDFAQKHGLEYSDEIHESYVESLIEKGLPPMTIDKVIREEKFKLCEVNSSIWANSPYHETDTPFVRNLKVNAKSDRKEEYQKASNVIKEYVLSFLDVCPREDDKYISIEITPQPNNITPDIELKIVSANKMATRVVKNGFDCN